MNKNMQAMLKKLKTKRGCQIEELLERMSFPQSADAGDPPEGGGASPVSEEVRQLVYWVLDDLLQLIQWGLVEPYESGKLISHDKIDHHNAPHLTFFLSKFAIRLEDALDISLTASPIFGPPKQRSASWPQLFMLMPFAPEMRPIFDDHIKKAAAEIGLSAARADDFFSRGSIIQDVWSAIYHAKVIVADCSKRNPNVFYEIGIAHTLGKDTVLISQSLEDIPFDLRHLRIIIYAYTPRGMDELEATLKSTLKDIL